MDKRIRDELDTLKDLIIEIIPVGKYFYSDPMPVDIIVSKEKKFNRRKSFVTIERQIEKNGILFYG